MSWNKRCGTPRVFLRPLLVCACRDSSHLQIKNWCHSWEPSLQGKSRPSLSFHFSNYSYSPGSVNLPSLLFHFSDFFDSTFCTFPVVVLSLCDPMDCSTPGFSVLHHFPKLAQTHALWVGDAIQPSHPLSSRSPPASDLSLYQGLSYRGLKKKKKNLQVAYWMPFRMRTGSSFNLDCSVQCDFLLPHGL